MFWIITPAVKNPMSVKILFQIFEWIQSPIPFCSCVFLCVKKVRSQLSERHRDVLFLLNTLALEELNFRSQEGNWVAGRKSEKGSSERVSWRRPELEWKVFMEERERSGRAWKFRKICGEKERQCLSNAVQAGRIYPFVCMTAINLTRQKCGDLELNPYVCVLS